jgi:hypothetical protein
MGWMARVQFPAVQDFSLLRSVQTNCGAQPLVQWVLVALSPGLKQQGHEVDHHFDVVPR